MGLIPSIKGAKRQTYILTPIVDLIYRPRQDIAQYVGTTYETLFRTLNEIYNEGLVILDGRRIRLTGPLLRN